MVEGARGCWWGEKHHCTFCGLNSSFMEYRSKSPDAFYDEVVRQVERHQVLDLYVVDNILDMKYLPTVLPRMHESDPLAGRPGQRPAGHREPEQPGAEADGQGRHRLSERTDCCGTPRP
ncbi:hypothetical protein ACQEWB_00215 [Streptomyces sp. CA-249302]|uniref:hypothetical protein n=1 Tax=Streptomyces sp. CA-249302 TaxID=3240058 RepID=UPI003D9098EC